MIVVVAIEGAVIAVLALLVVGLLRSHAEILKRLHELGAGIEGEGAPTAALRISEAPRPGSPGYPVMPQMPSPPDREGFPRAADIVGIGARARDAMSVRITGVEHDTIVAFLSSGCITCQKFWDAFRKPRKLGLPAGTRLVVVTRGSDAESTSAVAELAPSGVPTVMSTEAFTDYDIPGSPYFVHVHGPTGRVRGEGTGPDWDQVLSLLSQASGDAALEATLAPSNVPKPDADAEREARVDRELFEAGVLPGDPSLYRPPLGADDDAAPGDDPHAGHTH
jgi:hypothetical protein